MNLNLFLLLNYLYYIDFSLLWLTVDEKTSLLPYCQLYRMCLHRRKNISANIFVKELGPKRLPPNDFTMVMVTLTEITFGRCRPK